MLFKSHFLMAHFLVCTIIVIENGRKMIRKPLTLSFFILHSKQNSIIHRLPINNPFNYDMLQSQPNFIIYNNDMVIIIMMKIKLFDDDDGDDAVFNTN